MRALVIVVGLLGCEQPKTETRSPEPVPVPPPGPKLVEDAAPPAPVTTLPKQELEEALATASVYFADVTPMSGERRARSTVYDFVVRMKAPKADPDAPVLTETFTK